YGFPILRGIYLNPFAMIAYPNVIVAADKEPSLEPLQWTVISNSVIYGIIREQAREKIDSAIAADTSLSRLVAEVHDASKAAPAQSGKPAAQGKTVGPAKEQAAPASEPISDLEIFFSAGHSPIALPTPRVPNAAYAPARDALYTYLTAKLRWNERDAALLVEYASLDIGLANSLPRDRWLRWSLLVGRDGHNQILNSNLGPLSAIGEQKATQFFAQLASHFEKDASNTYEAIFASWGGDVRERAVDLATGQVRPREAELLKASPAGKPQSNGVRHADPAVYARVDHLDPAVKLCDADTKCCRSVLKNLPVTFTFAPMNLLHYQVTFPAKATRLVTIVYKQYPYVDSRSPASYQLAYVLHPATLWDDFGPINLKVRVPKGIDCKASVAVKKTGEAKAPPAAGAVPGGVLETYEATLVEKKDKSGELFVAIDKAGWEKAFPLPKPAAGSSAPAPGIQPPSGSHVPLKNPPVQK
ncbi:MAG: hypothetical protein ABSH20_31560, partial [Tepidisphaeraceae bacterium]